jgi:hypothetical protein
MFNGLGFWSWFWAPALHWYSVCVLNPTGGGTCTRPQKMSRSAAIDWQLDTQESNWNSTVELYQWTGYAWVEV